eukprot:TRINITY_DN4102_c0_g1_i1.p1 TRINITY_DN4102_c0_g1~~TRINITY_DN4102_c0_g1_i1.p1  ORF type:complete len:425 (+),score=118.83 TRINITY_DN4102_c0_g1_i1:108-1277(+)
MLDSKIWNLRAARNWDDEPAQPAPASPDSCGLSDADSFCDGRADDDWLAACYPAPAQDQDPAEAEAAALAAELSEMAAACERICAAAADALLAVGECEAEHKAARSFRRRLRRAARPCATVESSAASRAAGAVVVAVLRRRTNGHIDDDTILCQWSDGATAWEPLGRIHREHGSDGVQLLLEYEARRPRGTQPRDRGFRPFGWEPPRRPPKRPPGRRGAAWTRDATRGRPAQHGDAPRPAPAPAYGGGYAGAYGNGGGYAGAYAYGGGYAGAYGYGRYTQQQEPSLEYLETLGNRELRTALQHVQVLTEAHFLLLLRLSDDDVPKTATAEQLGRVQWAHALQEPADCLICLEGIDGTAALLPCAHGYHADCLRSYLETAKRCPVCKKEI